MNLVIAGTTVIQDEHGRYNLNQLHRASELACDNNKSPNRWTRRLWVKKLIEELTGTQAPEKALDVIHGGLNPGTYAHELLAVSYAGWISPRFQLIVNQAFIDSRTKSVEEIPELENPGYQAAVETSKQIIKVFVELDKFTKIAEEAKAGLLEMSKGMDWKTIDQYVYHNGLQHQLPPRVRIDYGKYLASYCREKNIPIYEMRGSGFQEWSYPITIIHDQLQPFLTRRNQPRLKMSLATRR